VELRSTAGLFQFRTQPEGATVWLDGAERGVTPLELEGIDLGEHQVRLVLDDHAEVFRPVDTTDGSKGEVNVSLDDEGARLRVRTGRADATVLVNGHAVGQGARVTIPMVERGNLRVSVQAPDAEPTQANVRVLAKGRVALRAQLEPSGGESELRVLPPIYQRWTFWAATGGAVAAGVTGTVLLAKALQPPAPLEGDVVVVLP